MKEPRLPASAMLTTAEGIPEVEQFLHAQEDLQHFTRSPAYAWVIDEYRRRAEEYNTTLEAAYKALRPREVSSGPFELLRVETDVDINRLAEECSQSEFLELGGSVDLTVSLDKAKFFQKVAEGKVPASLFSVVTTRRTYYKKIPKAVLP